MCVPLCVFISEFRFFVFQFPMLHYSLLCANKNFLLTYLLKGASLWRTQGVNKAPVVKLIESLTEFKAATV